VLFPGQKVRGQGHGVGCCLPLFVNWITDTSIGPFRCNDGKPKSVIIANPVPVHVSWWLVAHQIVCDCIIRTLIPFLMLAATLTSDLLTWMQHCEFGIASRYLL